MYPLPRQPFETKSLDERETNMLDTVATTLTASALRDYECFREECHGDVNEDDWHDWKVVKTQENLAVYQDLAVNTSQKNVAIVDDKDTTTDPSPGPIQALLCVGTIPGTLDDLMFGVVSLTEEDTKLKSSCIKDNYVDSCLIASILSPTHYDPWRTLTLKWAVNVGPVAMRPFARPRDFTYLESTGTTTNIDGERIGYHIIHSVVTPDTRKLHELNLIRGNLSLYYIYHQKSSNTVEVYGRAFWQLNGLKHSAFQVYWSVEATIAIGRIQSYVQMRKLSQLRTNDHMDCGRRSSCCSICKRSIASSLTTDNNSTRKVHYYNYSLSETISTIYLCNHVLFTFTLHYKLHSISSFSECQIVQTFQLTPVVVVCLH
ncbi:hypothetical protein PsorP6_013519 [Peronosclerospora sorghi]|uniref:Uncharacterized protein n=1 Tax=Peronosclerospora sorghi TaxID=230839 RepID=A0ACC0VIT6_9STRA|nr:hypothetical protein PsorP6_013519 [Peronosclerospora sorghi]